MRRGLAALLAIGVLVLALPGGAAASVRLGPDLTVPTQPGSQDCSNGSQDISPCTFVNLRSTNPDIRATSPINGVVTSWSFTAGAFAQSSERSIKLQTVVPGPMDGTGGLAYITPKSVLSTVVVPAGQGLSSPYLTIPVRAPISAGDSMSIVVGKGIMVYSGPAPGVTATFIANPDVDHGQTYPNNAYRNSVIVEPDADGDGYGDESQDCDPQNPSANEPDGTCRLLSPPPPVIPPPVYLPGGKCEKNCGGGASFGGVVNTGPAGGTNPDFFYLAINCPADQSQPCGGYVTVTRPKKPKHRQISARASVELLGKVNYVVSSGKTKKLKVKLSGAGRTALKSKGSLKVQITIVPNTGEKLVFTKNLKYQRPHKG